MRRGRGGGPAQLEQPLSVRAELDRVREVCGGCAQVAVALVGPREACVRLRRSRHLERRAQRSDGRLHLLARQAEARHPHRETDVKRT